MKTPVKILKNPVKSKVFQGLQKIVILILIEYCKVLKGSV